MCPVAQSDGHDAPWLIGEAVPGEALIFIHARDDPEFRFAALDSMSKLRQSGGMTAARYATRLDHVLSETVGLQRYGTKGECRNGQFIRVPSENENSVPALRKASGLPTLVEQSQIVAKACR